MRTVCAWLCIMLGGLLLVPPFVVAAWTSRQYAVGLTRGFVSASSSSACSARSASSPERCGSSVGGAGRQTEKSLSQVRSHDMFMIRSFLNEGSAVPTRIWWNASEAALGAQASSMQRTASKTQARTPALPGSCAPMFSGVPATRASVHGSWSATCLGGWVGSRKTVLPKRTHSRKRDRRRQSRSIGIEHDRTLGFWRNELEVARWERRRPRLRLP